MNQSSPRIRKFGKKAYIGDLNGVNNQLFSCLNRMVLVNFIEKMEACMLVILETENLRAKALIYSEMVLFMKVILLRPMQKQLMESLNQNR